MNPQQLRRRIAKLSPSSPATNRFTRAWLTRRNGQKEQSAVWYSTQQEHWLGWLKEMGGPGYYGRRVPPTSAHVVYNRIVNPQMLIYLAEAVGVQRSLVAAASADALRKSTMPGMSAAIRRRIPWTAIEERLQ